LPSAIIRFSDIVVLLFLFVVIIRCKYTKFIVGKNKES